MNTDTNKNLVAQRAGQVAMSDALFTPDQIKVMDGILAIVDRNPVIKWREGDPNHNLDFCLVEGKIEPVKSFVLKCVKMAGLNVESDSAPTVSAIVRRDGSPDTLVSVAVRVYSEVLSVRMMGSSSLYEVDTKGRNKRATHDAIARAQTRALKLAVETAVGMPFINMVLQKLFGGFEVTGAPEDEGSSAADEARQTWKRIWNHVHGAMLEGVITAAEQSDAVEEVRGNMDKPNILLDIEADWKRKIGDRRKAKGGS
jgi:hypothetical protein